MSKFSILDLLHAIEEDKTPLVNENEGAKPVKIILAAYESERTGEKVELN